MSQMFGKLPVNMPIDYRPGSIHMDGERGVLSARSAKGHGGKENNQKAATIDAHNKLQVPGNIFLAVGPPQPDWQECARAARRIASDKILLQCCVSEVVGPRVITQTIFQWIFLRKTF